MIQISSSIVDSLPPLPTLCLWSVPSAGCLDGL
jgi:hypothetical protein